MKRILSKRSGFTLIEIIVAFAIFAIMSSMLVSMVQLTLAQRSSNLAFQDRIERDTEYLAFHYIGAEDAFTGEADDYFNLDFGDEANLDIKMGYQKRSTTVGDPMEDGINYFVGNTNYTGGGAGGVVGGSESESDNTGGGQSQAARYETWLAGCKNLKWINVKKCEKDTTYDGAGVRYLIEISADGQELTIAENGTEIGSVPGEDVPYLQYKVMFYGTTTYTRTTVIGEKKYKYECHNGAEILDYGYIDAVGNPVSKDFVPGDGKHNEYLVIKTSPCTLRISPPFGSGAEFDGSVTTKIWVTFANDPQLTPASFGDNREAYGSGYRYKIYPMLNIPDNTPDGDKKNPNLYGAFKFDYVEIEDDDE